MSNMKIPIGTSDFAEIRSNGYYYVDKSGLIIDLLKVSAAKVMLITRPRRFGKTLAMNMLAEFFDIRKDSTALFRNLEIVKDKELCEKWMNQYPTLFVSFKSVDGNDFDSAFAMLKAVLSAICLEHFYLSESPNLNVVQKEIFFRLARKTSLPEEVKNGLLLLLQMMEQHYGKPVVLLVDEYDVPLAKASEKGYYLEMLDVIKGLMQVFKDNQALRFAVITGCLRVAKESIFTGTNNFKSDTISDTRLSEWFGFTETEIGQLLADTGCTAAAETIRQWYDGYHFGDIDVYCPWDVLNYIDDLMERPSAVPKGYWENTSDNSIVRLFLNRTDFDVTEKFETLLGGGYIKETIVENLTYDVLESSEDNLWSLLYLTGYLTKVRDADVPARERLPGQVALKIPNAEVMDIFRKSVRHWMNDRSAASDRSRLFESLWSADADRLRGIISDLLFDTISYHDYHESFYHAFLAGLVANAGYIVESNYEHGLGRSDLVIKDRKNRRAVVIEVKIAGSVNALNKECDDALRQIEDKQYAKKIERSGYNSVIRLGIAFYQKMCLIKTS